MSAFDGPAVITKEGWMRKKGKDRWFILCGRTLYWFTKEPVRRAHRPSARVAAHAAVGRTAAGLERGVL